MAIRTNKVKKNNELNEKGTAFKAYVQMLLQKKVNKVMVIKPARIQAAK